MKKWKYLLILPVLYISLTVIFNVIGETQELINPVHGATEKNWDKQSYWYYPWGDSGTHKGIDIFAPQKTPVFSPVGGIVISAGYSSKGGNAIHILGPKLRVYYFAHLNTKEVRLFDWVNKGQRIGTVGNTGNAISKPYHLHFSIFSIVPLVKNYTSSEALGWQKMFYLNPNKSLITD